jgi:hypothetical protein
MGPYLRSLLVTVGLSVCACGGSAPPPLSASDAPIVPDAPVPVPVASATPDAKKDTGPEPMPTTCEKKGDVCSPPFKWVKRLCGGFYPDVALAMFAKDSPWTRGYLTRDTQAWNASGGESSSDKLVYDEEVLVLAHKEADTGGMVVSGSSGGYDVLRWDGTCASLAGEEVTTRVPPNRAKAAKIAWKSLDLKVRDALAADERIGKIDATRRKECKGVTLGDVSDKCEKADKQLATAIVDFVRKGGTLPPPGKLP